jgi:hypothetical protein
MVGTALLLGTWTLFFILSLLPLVILEQLIVGNISLISAILAAAIATWGAWRIVKK